MKFSEVIGQQEVKERLRHSFKDGRIAHALLFAGAEGSGNFALALAFAQYISCPFRTEEDACGTCPTCRKFQTHQFADLYFSYPYFNMDDKDISDHFSDKWREAMRQGPYFDLEHWRNTLTRDNKQLIFGVKEAGNIIRKLALTSYEGGYKFMVIWMAELMKTDTANKLLKIVEEPPDNTIFLFIVNSMDNMLSTILSRVQVVYVPKLSDNDIMVALEKKGATAEQAKSITHYADGNWWRAWQLYTSHNPNELYAEKFFDWMRICYSKNILKIARWVEEMNKQTREEQKDFLVYVLNQVRQNLILNYTDENLVRMNEDEKKFSQKFSRFINESNACDLTDELNEAHRDISRNVLSSIVFTDLSVKMHYLLNRLAESATT